MERKKIAFALQGGGSHGAFTWGILEKLFEEDVLDIRGMCGTSAGAMNATIATYGYLQNGNKGAIDLLEKYWRKVANSNRYSMVRPSWLDSSLYPGELEYSPGYQMFNLMTNVFSPYQFNPMDYNPLKDILLDLVDFEHLKTSEMKLFVCATNVLTCKPKVFDLTKMSVDAVLASACLPFLFKAVEIEGESYWDGGYMGNPPIYPLIDGTDTNDILLLKVNPIEIKEVPRTVKEIQDRINDISFNTSLMAEMRMVYFKDKILNMGVNIRGRLRKIHFHAIRADKALESYALSSKFNTNWDFLNTLRKKGRQCAEEWIAGNHERVGLESTINIRKVYT